MDKKNPLIYTIIVTYNGMKWIKQCLKSLDQSVIKTHIIVIDNLSNDGTPQYIAKRFPSVELIISGQNLGFGKGNNIGLKKAIEAKADYVFLLNQDAWIKPDTLEKLITTHKEHNDYGIISPLHLDWSGQNLEYYFSSIIGPKECPNLINHFYFEKLNKIYPIEFIHAAAWFLPIKTLKCVGGFNPIFNHYCEDMEYINRVKFKNLKIGIVPNSIVMHWGTHKALKDLSTDLYFNYYFTLVEFLKPKYHLGKFYLIFSKLTFDKITSGILYRKWKVIITQLRLHFKITHSILKIRKVKKLSFSPKAYLN